MGFFKAIMRIARGEPVFVANQQTTPQPSAPVSSPPTATAGEPHSIPSVYIERVETLVRNGGFECDCFVQNYSSIPIVLERVELLGNKVEFSDRHMRPGEEYKFRIYSGPRLRERDQDCTLHYRTTEGDYFSSEHYIEFKQQPDHTYTIDRIRFTHLEDT